MEEIKKNKPNKIAEVIKEFGLSTISVKNSTAVLIMSIIISVMGIQSYVTMPKESFPEIVIPTIYVGTIYPGNSPVDIENLVSRPIEKELKSLTGVKKINSTSIQDYSVITVEFNPGIEVNKALQDVKDAVDKSKSDLPSDLDQDPDIFEINFSEFPIMYVNVSGDFPLDELKRYGEYLEEKFEALPEISKVDLKGIPEKEVKVWCDPHKMEARKVNFGDIEQAIGTENLTISGGSLLTGEFRNSVRIDGEFKDVSQLADIIVKTEKGNIVYLRDVARVEFAEAEAENYSRLDGKPVVTLDVVKRSGQNLLDASDKIKAIIDDAIKNRFPQGISIKITNDQSKTTRNMVSNLENSIISGILLVVAILMFFMGLRNAMFVGIAIPLSMFVSFFILNAFGVTLNMMVLFSLILALGMLVDNGIVVVENTYRLLQMGYSRRDAAIQGVGQVAVPIITSTLTTLAAFFPLIFWQDLIGEFMKYLPITLIVVLAASLFVGLVVNPAIADKAMKLEEDQGTANPKGKKRRLILALAFIGFSLPFYFAKNYALANILAISGVFGLLNLYMLTPFTFWFQTKLLVWLETFYSRFLFFALSGKRPWLFFGGAFGLLLFSFVLIGIRSPKVVFFPDNEPQYVNIFLAAPIGTDIEKTNALTKRLEADVSKLIKDKGYAPIVESVVGQVGQSVSDPSEGPSPGVTPHKSRVTVSFVEFQYRNGISSNQFLEDVRELVKQYPGVEITASKDNNGPPVGKPVNLEVSGEDYEKLIRVTENLKLYLNEQNIAGIEELKTDLETGQPELSVDIDRDKARRFGLSTGQIAMEIRTALFGKEASKYKEGEDDYKIQIRLDNQYRYNLEALMNQKIFFMDKMGGEKQIPISSVASVTYGSTFGSVKRKDLDRVIQIFSNLKEGYNANEVVAKVQSALADYQLPEGYTVKITGEQEEQNKSAAFLGNAMLIAVFLIFLIIVAQFNSIKSPFIIMFSVLFSITGVIFGLVLFNMDFVIIMTGIGIISLAGVVVNNAIVLIDYTNFLRSNVRLQTNIPYNEKLSRRANIQTLVEAGRTRLRPVLLTAITTVLGLVPLAVGLNIDFWGMLSRFDPQIYTGGDNALFWGPMAWTVIFGLTFATFLTLVIVPVMYLIFEPGKGRGIDKFKAMIPNRRV